MKRLRIGIGLVFASSLALAACGGSSSSSVASTTTGGSGAPVSAAAGSGEAAPPEIVVGAQDFGESAILAQVYGQALESWGFKVKQQSLGGYRDLVYTAFDSGAINFTAEYAASALDHLAPATATPNIDETVTALRDQLAKKKLTALEPAPAVDSNSFVVTKETAAKLSGPKVSALTEDLRLGAAPDCPNNPSCLPGLKKVYGLDLSPNYKSLDGGGPLTKAALESGDIDVAVLFSTDASIAAKGWVVLEDDKNLINADNIVPVVSQSVTDSYAQPFTDRVNAVSAKLTTADLTEMNRRYEIDKEDTDVIAKDWLTKQGLIS